MFLTNEDACTFFQHLVTTLTDPVTVATMRAAKKYPTCTTVAADDVNSDVNAPATKLQKLLPDFLAPDSQLESICVGIAGELDDRLESVGFNLQRSENGIWLEIERARSSIAEVEDVIDGIGSEATLGEGEYLEYAGPDDEIRAELDKIAYELVNQRPVYDAFSPGMFRATSYDAPAPAHN
ncbi:MAG: hypothetical protein AB7G06_06455 [Bdellovibrionales bacterium]